jgi:hypothetical protein
MAEEKPEPLDLDKLLAPYSRGADKKGAYTPVDLSPTKLIKDAFKSGHGGQAAGVVGAGAVVYKGITGYSDAIKTAHRDLITRFKEEEKLAGQVTNRRTAVGNTRPTAPDMTKEGKVVRRGLAKELAKERLLTKIGNGNAKRVLELTTPQVTTNPTPDLRSPNMSMHNNPPTVYDAKKLAALGKEGKLAAGTEAQKLRNALQTAEGLPKLPPSWIERAANNTLFRAASSPWVTRPIKFIDAASNTFDVIGRHGYQQERADAGEISQGSVYGRTAAGAGRGVSDFFSLGIGTAFGEGYRLEEQFAGEAADKEYRELNKKDPVRYPLKPFNRPYNGNDNIEMIVPQWGNPEYDALLFNQYTREGIPNYMMSPRDYKGPEYIYKVIDGKVQPILREEVAAVREQDSLDRLAVDQRRILDRGYYNLDPAFGPVGWRDNRPTGFNFGDYRDYMLDR